MFLLLRFWTAPTSKKRNEHSLLNSGNIYAGNYVNPNTKKEKKIKNNFILQKIFEKINYKKTEASPAAVFILTDF